MPWLQVCFQTCLQSAHRRKNQRSNPRWGRLALPLLPEATEKETWTQDEVPTLQEVHLCSSW